MWIGSVSYYCNDNNFCIWFKYSHILHANEKQNGNNLIQFTYDRMQNLSSFICIVI